MEKIPVTNNIDVLSISGEQIVIAYNKDVFCAKHNDIKVLQKLGDQFNWSPPVYPRAEFVNGIHGLEIKNANTGYTNAFDTVKNNA